jgi:serine/threonine-protein kinase
MEELIGLIAILMVFGTPTFIVGLVLRHRERMRRLESGDQPQMKALQAERDMLENRVRNLESIVCNVDFELNAKLDRLASRQLDALGPAAGGETGAGGGARAAIAGLEPGSTLGDRFRVDRPLGAGGMGAVYLAHDQKLDEPVALKVIAGIGLLDPAAAERLRREASAARKISHANVVRLHDLGEADGVLFLSMEFVNGQSLRDLLQRHGTLSLVQVREVAAQMCDGLQAAHDVGVIHRDLKPANVLLDEHQRVKIIDFGLARLPHLEGMTTTGMIVGTPEYMAPEQIRGGAVDGRTDLYALGALLYHMLCGRPPFTGENPIAVSLSHAQDPVPPPTTLRRDLPPAWEELLLRALAKDPAERFQTASALREALPPT